MEQKVERESVIQPFEDTGGPKTTVMFEDVGCIRALFLSTSPYNIKVEQMKTFFFFLIVILFKCLASLTLTGQCDIIFFSHVFIMFNQVYNNILFSCDTCLYCENIAVFSGAISISEAK